ncbi:MAG TPA: plastocyanin/azurin family copper-binding protein, partial [Herpetosiphonaceae bacterium]|nr:plastocyanin/azurin family copper-binding protein [Herpetosiphonaceae bacterium]
MKKILSAMLLIVALTALAACGGEAATTAPTSAPAAGGDTTGGAAASASVTVNSADGATLKFAEETLTAAAGEVEVTFNNKATPGLLHNWVLVKPGEEQKAVDESTANSPSFLPTATFIGHTETIDAAKSSTAKFTVEPGTY